MTTEISENIKPSMKPSYLVPIIGVNEYVKDMGPQTRSAGEALYDGFVASYHASTVFLVGSGLAALVDTIAQYVQ